MFWEKKLVKRCQDYDDGETNIWVQRVHSMTCNQGTKTQQFVIIVGIRIWKAYDPYKKNPSKHQRGLRIDHLVG